MANNLWVYKCNRVQHDYASSSGDWQDVFEQRKAMRWGGSWSMKNSVSVHILNELMQEGDLVLAYQTDDRCLIGTCRVAKLRGKPGDRALWLKPVDLFDVPVPIHELRKTDKRLQQISAFRGNSFPQTLYAVSPKERKLLEAVCGVCLTVAKTEPVLPLTGRSGAGFGDPETNRLVEKAAVRIVKGKYRRAGWKVQSVEAKRCGFDLNCTKRKQIEHVEVKGVAGSEKRFIVTASELRQAKSNDRFVLCVVTNARSPTPVVTRLKGSDVESHFQFRPLQLIAEPRQ